MPFLFSFLTEGTTLKGEGGTFSSLFTIPGRIHDKETTSNCERLEGEGLAFVWVSVYGRKRGRWNQSPLNVQGGTRDPKKRTTIASGCAQYQAAASCPSLFRRHPNSSPSARQRALASLGGDTNYKIKITVSTDRYESV